MKHFFLALLLGLLGLSGSRVGAQPIPDALFIAGTTAVDASGRSWAYLAFRPTDDRVLAGRALSVHAKNGLPGDPGTFRRVGVVRAERDATVMAVLMERGRQLGEDLAQLAGILAELHRARGGDAALVNPTPAQLLAGLLARASVDTETMGLLRLVGQAHPAVKMALGEAWAGPLTAAAGAPVTLEVREQREDGSDGGVVGRATLTAGQVLSLPAPGPPVQMPDLSPKGDLNIKLRWGQGDELRRQAPLSGGFSVWRVARSFAVAHGVDGAAPGLVQLREWARSGEALRITEGPIFVPKVLGLAEAVNVGAEPGTYFVVDDGNRYRKNAAGVDVDEPMAEGSEFAYFVCARDILGRDGTPSRPGHGMACRTLPPLVPGGLRAENHWTPRDADGTQTIQFGWNANANGGRDVTHYYEVYRGTNLTQLQSNEAKALLVPVSGKLAHPSDGTPLSFVDEAPEVVSAEFGLSFWYSVRAVHVSPCGPIRSDFAAPVLVSRRRREGPPPPSGFVDFNCHRASVIAAGQEIVSDPALPLNDEMVRIRVQCRRMDPGIASADLSVRVDGVETDLGQHVYAAEGDWVVADFEIHRNALAGRAVTAMCRTTTHGGARSNPKEMQLEHLSGEGRREATFRTRTLGDADLLPGEPFSDELLEPPVAAAVVSWPGGAAMAGPLAGLEGRHVVVQTSPLAVAVANYVRRGNGEVRDGTVYFGVPPVPEAGRPPALSARVFPIREFSEQRCLDLAYDPGTGSAGKLGVVLFPTARSAEYRLFRRIDEGPYSLIGQGAVAELGGALAVVRREDDGLPATDCMICYYAQTVDRDGNASALVRLDSCVERRAPTLPKPNLAPPEATGTAAAARMRLTWACPPQNVERFLVTIKAKGGAAAKSALERAAGFSLVAPLAARVVQYHSAGGDEPKEVATRAAGTAAGGLGGGGAMALNFAAGTLTFQKMVQTSSFVTPALGRGYPATPPFTAEFEVQPGVVYSVFVQAVRGPMLAGKGRGPASSTYEFKWEEAGGPEPAVAWPARALESVMTLAGVEAGELRPVLWPSNLDGQRPVGVRLAMMANARGEDVVVAGNEVVFAPAPDSPNHRRQDPNAHWLGDLGDGVGPAQGVILYRQQVANALFPTVPGDTIQVSPLIRRIAWIPTTAEDGRAGARLIDPYFALTLTPAVEAERIPERLHLWLLDTQGVVDGARYRYYLVCLGRNGEIRRTLDAGFQGPP